MAALNPEPGDSVDLSDLPPVPRRRNTDILRNPSPQLRNPSPGHRNPSPHGEGMDVDITAVKSEPEDKGYEVCREHLYFQWTVERYFNYFTMKL
jgi:hypothetical protein